MLDLAVADNLKTEFYTTLGCSLSSLSEVVRSDLTLLGVSDGGAHTKFFTAGRYPTETIQRLVRENPVMSLEEAHWNSVRCRRGARGSGIVARFAKARLLTSSCTIITTSRCFRWK